MKAKFACIRRPLERLVERRKEWKERHGKWCIPREMIYAVTGDPRALNIDRKLNDFRREQQAVREAMNEERRLKEELEKDCSSLPASRYASVYAYHLGRATSHMESALQLGSYALKGKAGRWLMYDLQTADRLADSLHSQMERLDRQLEKMKNCISGESK